MLDLSFRPNLPPLLRGGPDDVHTLVHYKHFIFGSEPRQDKFNYVDIGVFFNTIFTAILVTVINLCFCYPIAFYMAKVASPGTSRLLIISLIIPFWINELLRSFALRILFAGEGVINNVLLGTGLIDTGINFIAQDVALYTGLTYAYILLMIFPLYNAIESLDSNQLEAAKDLGSSTIRTQWFNMNDNWSRGSAYSILLLTISVTFVLLMMRIFKVKIGEIIR